MARPNHQFEKRQRELAKKKKKEEKRQRKLQQKTDATESDAPAEADSAVPEDSNA